MGISQESVQDLVNYALKRYEEQSVLEDVVDVVPYESQHAEFDECEEELSIEEDRIGSGVVQPEINEVIRRITVCEELKFLRGLKSNKDEVVDISLDFGRELLNKGLTSLQTPNQLFLPDQTEYRRILATDFDISDMIPYNPNVSIHWFNPSILGNIGFLTNDRVAVIQKKQGDIPVVSEDIDVDQLQQDNSHNPLRIHLGDGGFGSVQVNMWSEFSSPQTFDDESISLLLLPNPRH